MNHIYRSIWNQALGAWVAVSENSKSKGKGSSTRRKLLVTGLLICTSPSWALPTDGQVVAGQVGISTPVAGQMQIDQSSQKAIVNWQGFSVAQGESVNINQPNAQATLLNRVVGQDASQIQGQLHANGQVYLVNPNGVIFGKTAQVDVGGLVATTHNISNKDFLDGKNHFIQNGAKGTVENHGTITTPDGGVVALIGETVTNTGTINTPKGTTALAAGKTVDLDFKGDGLVEVKVTEAALKAQVDNKGAILADGGRVVLTAKAAGQLVDTVINQQGIVRAQGLVERNGEIILDGGNTGVTQVSGTLDASSQQTGGKITVTGDQVKIQNTAKIDASGDAGGGAIVVGDKLATSQTTLQQGASIKAQARNNGKAGKIEVFANMDNGTVNVDGELNASAPKNGDGGFIDTSAAHVKIADTAKISTKAANGNSGTWLIDPVDFTISAGNAAQTASGIGADTLSSNLGNGNISIVTGATTAGNGDIFVNSPVTWAANQLSLSAHRDININADMNASGTASLNLKYGQANNTAGAGYYFINNRAKINLPAGANFSTQKGKLGTTVTYQVITSLGTANSITGTDLQGMNGSLASSYALGANIDASAIADFTPVGNLATPFSGNFAGLGHTITNFTVNRPATDYVGLFGHTATNSTIRDVGLIGGSVTGKTYVGALVGRSYSTVSNVYSTANVTSGAGNRSIGGLIGSNYGTVNNTYVTGNVTGGVGSYYLGGLIGYNAASIKNVYATGNVTGGAGSYELGGLIGSNNASVNNAYATGNVTGGTKLGGLAGSNTTTINNSFWNTQSTGQATGVASNTGTLNNVSGKTTAEMMQANTFASWGADISSVGGSSAIWRIYDGQSAPWLRSFLTPLTITAGNQTGVYNGSSYDGSLINATYSVADAASSGRLTNLATLYGNAVNVGTYNPIGLYSDQQGYDIIQTIGTLSITPATLTATIIGTPTKTYDSTTDANLAASNYKLTGFITGQGASVTQTTGAYNSADVLTANTVTASLAAADFTANTGTLLSNYTLPTIATGAGNISTATLTAAITGTPSKTYDSTTDANLAASNYKLTGFITGQGASVTQTTGAYNSADVLTANAVTASLAADDFTANTGTLLSNYTLPTSASGAGNINAATLTVATNDASKTYDGLAYTGGNGVTYSGFVNGEDSNVLGGTLTYGGAAQGATNAGTYALSTNGLTSGNYNIAYSDGQLLVNPAALTIYAIDASKIYDSLAYTGGNGVVYAGFVNGETKNVLGGTLTYGGKSQGASNIGVYSIVPQGLNSKNYTLSFINGNLTIANKPAIPVINPINFTVNINVTGSNNRNVNIHNQVDIHDHAEDKKASGGNFSTHSLLYQLAQWFLRHQLVPLHVSMTFMNASHESYRFTEESSQKYNYSDKKIGKHNPFHQAFVWIEIENKGILLPKIGRKNPIKSL